MKRLTLALTTLIFGLIFLHGSASAYTIYSDGQQSAFLAALSNYNMITFDSLYTYPAHELINGNEYSSSDGVRFTSPLSDSLGKLYIESIPSHYLSNFLSVDRAPYDGDDGNNDSMVFTMTTTAYAFGLNVVDNGQLSDQESVTVYGDSGSLYTNAGIPDFFGIIAEQPITSVYFSEASGDGDDIGYDNIVIGNVSAAPVPEPATMLLLGSGLFGLLGFRRKFIKK